MWGGVERPLPIFKGAYRKGNTCIEHFLQQHDFHFTTLSSSRRQVMEMGPFVLNRLSSVATYGQEHIVVHFQCVLADRAFSRSTLLAAVIL